jgi:hypothetical protein
MASELAAGYISLSVKLAKGGMADVTKEVKKAGQEGGAVYSDEFNKKVGTEVGKKLPDVIGKSTKSSGSGGLKQAAKEAAEEFGKGVLEGIEKELKSSGGIEKSLEGINTKVRDTTDILKDLGGAAGMDTTGIETAAGQITTAIDGIGTSVGNTKDALKEFKSGDIAGGLSAAADALKGLESIGLPEGFSREVGDAATKFSDTQKSVNDVTTALEGLPLGKFEKVVPFLDEIIAAGGLVSDAFKVPLDAFNKQFDLARHEGEDFGDWWHRFVLGLSKEEFELRMKPLNLQPTKEQLDRFFAGYTPAITSPVLTPPGTTGTPGTNPLDVFSHPSPGTGVGGRAGHAAGGVISGPGGIDNVLSWLTAGEGVVTKSAMQSGGAAIVAALNRQGGIPGFDQGLSPGADQLRSILMQQWPSLVNVNGDVNRKDSYGEHSSGNALDVMIPNYGSEAGIAMGNAVKDFVLANAGTLDLKWAIWRDKIYKPGGQVDSYGNPASSDDNNQHRNHVHVFLAGKNVKAPSFNAASLFGGGGGGGATPHGGGGTGGGATPHGGGGTGGGGTTGGGTGQSEQMRSTFSALGQLADIGVGGIKETFLPPGFSDPTQWPNVKSLAALLQWGGGMIGGIPGQGNKIAGGILSGAGSAITGNGAGVVSAIESVTPAPFGTLAPSPTAAQFGQPGGLGMTPGVGTGPAPGPGTTVNIGQVNEPTQSIITAANRQTASDQNTQLGSRRWV